MRAGGVPGKFPRGTPLQRQIGPQQVHHVCLFTQVDANQPMTCADIHSGTPTHSAVLPVLRDNGHEHASNQ